MKVVVRVVVPLVALIVASSAQSRRTDAIVFPASGSTILYPILNPRVNYSPQVPLNVQPLQPRTNSSQQVPHDQSQHSQGPSTQSQLSQGQNPQSQFFQERVPLAPFPQPQFSQGQIPQAQFSQDSNPQAQFLAGPNPQRAPPIRRPSEEKYTISNNKDHDSSQIINFAWSLFKKSKPIETASNLVLSPIILQFLLAILEKAADGETKNQLRNVVGNQSAKTLQPLFKPSSRNVQLESASGIFIDSSENLSESFANYAQSLGTDIFGLDFRQYPEQSKARINQWASDITHGTITELISPTYDVQHVSIILATAMYFHSNWLYRFSETHKDLFYSFAGGPGTSQGTPTDFMILKQNLVVDIVDLGHGIGGKIIEIPYDDDNYSMLVIVPANNVTLDQFIGQLTVPMFESIVKNTPHKLPRLVTLKMPKFKINSRFSVLNTLLKMGVVDLFTINSNLQHLGLRGPNKISDIIQEARLAVDENGTVASAATGSFLIPLSAAPKQDYIFNVQKPFLAVIIDKTNDIPLFISELEVDNAIPEHETWVKCALRTRGALSLGVLLLLTTRRANLRCPLMLFDLMSRKTPPGYAKVDAYACKQIRGNNPTCFWGVQRK